MVVLVGDTLHFAVRGIQNYQESSESRGTNEGFHHFIPKKIPATLFIDQATEGSSLFMSRGNEVK